MTGGAFSNQQKIIDWPTCYMISKGWTLPKVSMLELLLHTFDNDSNITAITCRYKLECIMLDGTKESHLIDEIDLMPYKVGSGIINSINFFKLQKKIYFRYLSYI